MHVTVHIESVTDGITVHWQGVDVPNPMDGVAWVTQDAVMEGESAVMAPAPQAVRAPATPRVEAREPTPTPVVAPAPEEAPVATSPARAGSNPPAAPARPRVVAAPKRASAAAKQVPQAPAPAPKESDGWEDDR